MNDIESLRKQIRFQLSKLATENAHHQFEDLCRHLTRNRICSNILPATGPVSAGGDQGRDFETFQTYLTEHPVGDSGGFTGMASAHPLAFACSLQQKKIPSKVKTDVATIAGSGTPVDGVHFFCERDVPIATRHALQAWARETHKVHLEIYDGKTIAELLAQRDTFWIAVRFLGLPETAFPAIPDDSEDDWYPTARQQWQEVDRPYGFADFQELSDGARRALNDRAHREDLPFWLARLRLIAEDTFEPLVRRRAIAEIAALSIRGLKTLSDCDTLVRAYFEQLESFPDSLDLEDAAVTYNYTFAALKLHVTTITAEELTAWRTRLRAFVDKLLKEKELDRRPNRHADLLDVRGYVALTIDPLAQNGPNIDEAIAYWKKLLDVVPNAPLYQITRFADHLTKFVTLFGNHPEFSELSERSDTLVAKRHGGFAAASKARDRAMQFYEKGDLPRAISELHRTRANWFSKETLGGSILAFLTISTWYREIGLNFAAKYYGFAAAFIAVMADDAEVRKRFPQGLALAAESEYEQGAWCGYLELVNVAERAAFLVLPAIERDIPHSFQNLIFANAMVIVLTERLVPERTAYVKEYTSTLALHEIVTELLPSTRATVAGDEDTVRQRVAEQLVGPAFADLGTTRLAAWNAYGTEWRVRWDNSYPTTAVAEEFCAILQIFLVDIHAVDLYLLPTTVDIRVEVEEGATPKLHASPSNAARAWTVTLPTNQTEKGFHELQQHVFVFGVTILTEISLLPQDELLEMIETLFKKGFKNKTTVARPYSELFHKFTPEDLFNKSNRVSGPSPGDWHPRVGDKLPWNRSNGRSYEHSDALARVQARYKNSLLGLKHTLPRLRRSQAFQQVVSELRREGWRDWHILMATLNATMNLRMNAKINAGGAPEAVFEEYRKKLAQPYEEVEAEPAPPADLYTADRLRDALKTSYLSTLKQLGFVVHQQTPDFPAIEEFLRHRYHYWDDDVEHQDPFADHERASTGRGDVI